MPQLPVITVVTPWLILHAISGSLSSARSSWVCVSMKPGASARPFAGDLAARLSAEQRSPIATMRSSFTARSPRTPGLPLPSISSASRITRSGCEVTLGGMPCSEEKPVASLAPERLLRARDLGRRDDLFPFDDVGLDALGDRLGRAGLRIDALDLHRLLHVRRGHDRQHGLR